MKLTIKADEKINADELASFIRKNRGDAEIIFAGRAGLPVSNAMVKASQAARQPAKWWTDGASSVARA